MPSPRGRLGARGEHAASIYLESLGYAILSKNYRCPWGEVDLVTRHRDVLVFVEVRTRRSATYGAAEESVTPAKARRLIATAETYLQEHSLADAHWRIDLVVVEQYAGRRRIRHLANAVERPA